MLIGPRYKIARRLGAGIFEKTSTQKFLFRQGEKSKARPRGKSDFSAQLLEKQKARFTYGVNERQFAKYVNESLEKKGVKADETLYSRLERRLDNAVYRLGLVSSRQAGRQMVSHGHILVNGKRVTVPSFNVVEGDKITIAERSQKKALFSSLAERMKGRPQIPSWLKFDIEKKEAVVQGAPKMQRHELIFDIGAILEFYRR